MKRSEKSQQLKNSILDATRELLLAQGYQKTTIRQITAKVGINTGSLYHFFRDKDDIFKNIVIETYKDIIAYSDSILTENQDPAFRYALTRALEMKAIDTYNRIAELYHVAYSSWPVTQAMLPINMERKQFFFHSLNPDFTEKDYYNRSLALRGMRLSFISRRLYEGPGNLAESVAFLIETALSMFNVPEDHIRGLIPKVLDILDQELLELYGFTL